jgi:putative tryptophan/tyrosine transport system substrate-binding protein
MKRRVILAATAAAALSPAMVRAQQKAMPVIGWLSGSSPGSSAPQMAAFRQGLGETGYVEGQNVTIEARWAENHDDQLPALAADLVNRKVDVITASGGPTPARVSKSSTSTIPIVFAIGGDPVATGLVASMARPGGNLTGVSYLVVELNPKRLDLLSQLVPQAGSIAVLVNPGNPNTAGVIREMQETARLDRAALRVLPASSEREIDAAFASLVQGHAGALVVQADPFFTSRREYLVALAARHAVPAIYSWRDFVTAGGLASYGPNLATVYRQLGIYTGKILKGAKPADLPVEQPTRLELVINMKTAKALGLTIPPSILARADEVIE